MFAPTGNTADMSSVLREFLARHSRMSGARLLDMLIHEPNTPIDVLELALRLDHQAPEQLPFLALLASAYADIPALDRLAVCQYRQRLAQLLELKERLLLENPDTDTTELDWELNFLARELRWATTSRGAIKNLNPDKKKALDRFRIAVKRLLAAAETENPALARYIRRHLRCGKAFVWRAEP